MAVVRTPDEFEAELARYLYERSEEGRAVRVGEKETSEQAAIVERYADLFTREQHDTLREAEGEVRGEARERLYRLREAALGGVIVGELAEESDRLENAILADRVEFRGESLPLRSAQAQLAILDEYEARDQLGELASDASARFNCDRYGLMQKAEALDAELSGDPDPVRRSAERKNIDLHALAAALADAARRQDESWEPMREQWLDRILGTEREAEPASYHVSYLRRMSPLADLYAKERSVPICLETLSSLGFDLAANDRIKLDLDDRPQKSPRACVIASDPPAVVHLITRAQGGLHDYQAFLHEAGHALHYAGLDPELPYTFRRLSRDHALTEIYSFLIESITREPGWHALHFGLSDAEDAERAEAARFLEVLLFRRYAAKLAYELGVLGRLRERERPRPDLRRQPPRRGRLPLPGGRLPRGHGRRLLLGRLSAGVDPHGAAAGVPARRRSARTGGAGQRRASSCRRCSPRGRGRRARRSPTGSATTRSTRPRSWMSS